MDVIHYRVDVRVRLGWARPREGWTRRRSAPTRRRTSMSIRAATLTSSSASASSTRSWWLVFWKDWNELIKQNGKNSVDSSAPSIMPPWVRVPSTPSTLYHFKSNLCYICLVKRTKISKKRPGLAHLKTNCRGLRLRLRLCLSMKWLWGHNLWKNIKRR